MDHIKKLVYIIVGCLTIVSLVFTLCHKVGHCASSENVNNYVTSFPLPVNSSYGISNKPNDFNLDSVVSSMLSACSINVDCIVVEETGVNYIDVQCFEFGNKLGLVVDNTSFDYFTWHFNVNRTQKVRYTYSNGNSVVNGTYGAGNSTSGMLHNSLDTLPNNSLYLPTDSFVFFYPIYISSGSLSYNGVTYFTEVSNIISGHTKGGVLVNYIDSDDLIEQDSSLPSVDTSPPSDTTSNPAWYQKILNGLGKINQSLKGGVLTIGDYLGQIKEDLENAIAWITEPPDSDTILDNVVPYLAQNDLISGFLSSKSAIQGVYTSIGNVSAKTSSQMVWDIPFNLPSMSQTFHATIDFGWYENIRSTFEPFLNMFLCIGFLFSFIRSIPGILHGNSGEGDT